ncbi:MAG TPA: starch-binding protein [Cyclobacteriaceae bacterium]|nr:starch-binding protein [Cyclobacteriaceae bacterium]
MKVKVQTMLFCLMMFMLLQIQLATAQVDFRKETIYFLLPTRFFDGDPTNNRPNEWCSYGPNSPAITDPNDVPWRGDFKGLIQKLDYIKDLGFTAIWITPIVQNRGPLDYHGYHAWDFTKVDPRLESPGATFQDLINEVHARGMKIVLDIVTNHSGRFGIKGQAELKYNTDPTQAWYAADNPNWQYDGITPNPVDGKIWSRANLAKLPAPYNSNLAAFNWPCTESFVNTSDINWFHHSGNGFVQGWDDTENLYNRAIAGDCPDLNTGSQVLRDYLVAAYTTFINMGVDAFRWDTMKHMDRADALYFLDKFKAVNPNLFVFAEVAQKRFELHPVEEINPHWYTWRGAVGSSANSGMAVLDFYAEATFHNVFQEGQSFSNVTAAARYDNLYSDPSTNLTWLDNHDFGPNNDWNQRYGGTPENLAACMNFMFTWRGIPVVYYGTEVQFKKGVYTDIHDASGISQSLDVTGRAYYGAEFTNAPNHKIYQHIKKLNAMRKAIPALQNGTWTWAGTSDGNGVGYIRKSGTSEVAVGLAKDGVVTFNFTGLTNGTYRDAVTGNAVVVSNGNLSFTVQPASAGLYVLNGPGIIGGNGVGYFQSGSAGGSNPVASISPDAGNYASAIQVTLSATGSNTPIKIYYTTDGSTPTTSSALYSTPFTLSTNSTVKALAVDSQNLQSTVASNAYTFGTLPSFTVNFKKPSTWSTGAVKIYYWNVVPSTSLSTVSWPGVDASANATASGWYTYTFTNVTSTSLIFNDNGSTTNKTADLTRSTTGWYKDGVWYDSNPEVTTNAAPVVTVTPAGPYSFTSTVSVTISATDDSGATPTLYYTTDGSTPTTSSASAAGSKTLSFSATTTLKVYAVDNASLGSALQSHTYTLSATTGLKIHLKTTWATPKIYYWNATPGAATTTWPGVTMTSEGNGWYVYTIPNGATCSNIIFSNNGASQTADLNRCNEGWYDSGTWYNSDPTVSTGLKLHLNTTWATPKLYYWNVTPTASTTTWPGVTMTSEGNGWYVYTIPNATCANVIFSNNGATQTADLYRCNEGWYSNGTWSSTLPSGRIAQSENVSSTDDPNLFSLEHYPNPASGTSMVRFTLPNDSFISLKLFNDQGVEVSGLHHGHAETGTHTYEVNTLSFKPGLYLYRLTSGKHTEIKKLIIIH